MKPNQDIALSTTASLLINIKDKGIKYILVLLLAALVGKDIYSEIVLNETIRSRDAEIVQLENQISDANKVLDTVLIVSDRVMPDVDDKTVHELKTLRNYIKYYKDNDKI
ncbi:hypothetical protein Q9X96_003111 [Vibrio vulnificus]|nr:hypothetical protein [Vibrio vulnificus]